MDPTDVHSFPPSDSLAALSSITPPSPILSAIGISCSSESIPILFDFGDEPTISCSRTSTSLCATDHRGSVGTFGPLHPHSPAFPGSSDPSWPALDHSTPAITTPRGSPNSHSPYSTAIQDIETSELLGSSQTTSTLHTLLPSPSVNSRPSSPRLRRKFKFPIDCNGPTLPASKSWVPVSESRGENSTRLSVPGTQRPLSSPDVRPPPLARQQSPNSTQTYGPKELPLQKNLFWLEDIVVELLVDQEGFRAVHPTFKLVGFPKQARGWDSSDGGLALFRPVKRETFHFHYAPFDSDFPLIRRLTINDDESRDFLSRQAYLSLKVNGVYTVQGGESSHLPSSCFESGDFRSSSEHTKLKWRFEYLVEDRLHESGRIVDGEKSLTPISFLCSPYLLHPSQARKMKFMHIVKKSVTTKLVAEKLEPPTWPAHSGPPPPPPSKPAANKWTLHRRVQSTYADEPKTRKKTGSIRVKARRDENQEHPVVRRRRASSAGDERRPNLSGCLPPEIPLTRNILPRAQLAELLNAESKEVGTHGLLRELPWDFQGLRPAPRRT
ncbi:hypothetical protein B0H19DRAFT_1127901 [Mycena capillaripes]|nr:hypothetical protein B0H19DRAFT_1127901 [Mycena capillaripes]